MSITSDADELLNVVDEVLSPAGEPSSVIEEAEIQKLIDEVQRQRNKLAVECSKKKSGGALLLVAAVVLLGAR